MAKVQFLIAVESTDDTIYPSFPNIEFGSGDPFKIKLKSIRSKCRISEKLFFTTNGRTCLDNSTTLGYYMSLLPEGQEILKLFKNPEESEVSVVDLTPIEGESRLEHVSIEGGADVGDPKNGETESPENKSEIGTKILQVKVTDGKLKASPLISGADQTAFKSFVDKLAASSLTPGVLPSINEKYRQLSSLTSNWATSASSKDYTEPADLTEQQWDRVLSNNRALHGYFYSPEDWTIIKAPKRAFKLRSNKSYDPKRSSPVTEPANKPAPLSHEITQLQPMRATVLSVSSKLAKNENLTESVPAAKEEHNGAATEIPLPSIPPFYVYDDADITVTEISHNFQKTMLKEGFSSQAIEGNVTFGIPVSISSSLAKEQGNMNQDRKETNVKSLAAVYSFPRVRVELDSDALELTDECKRDAYLVTNEDDVEKFDRKYGSIFATSFTLGGYLHSSQDLTTKEVANLAQTKNKMKFAAGLSIQSSYGGGGGNYGKTESDGSNGSNVTLDQDSRLAWSARGGDTILCSNPAAWAATVKDYRLWRVMDQQRFVGVKYLIQDLDTQAYTQLADPKPVSIVGDQDMLKNQKYFDKLIAGLDRAMYKPDNNLLAQKVEELYRQNFENLDEYNKFCEKANDPTSQIPSGIDWVNISKGKRAMFGMFMYYSNKLERPTI
ncbi:hypothetical protein TWF225_002861 [Orbilia oligospora]|nr:hypothetical protein TWF225_002861 [Orbilia oligospora]KAF3253322.1 hypothetical protein TWF128_006415 [Orbilia oligospora]KAF3263775.1 hypothetical protein TWF217_003482 [Orbilia oligospora]KAF3297984.1 hypothetical protein TWF132_004129 [Orbilia oligospora]